MTGAPFQRRVTSLQQRLTEQAIAAAFITDEDSVYYFSGFYDYLHMEFGRPSVLIVPGEGACTLVTASIEREMAERTVPWARVEAWQDGLGDEWRGPLRKAVAAAAQRSIGIEIEHMPPIVRRFMDSIVEGGKVSDVTPLIADMRMIKGEEELRLARHAGQVAEAMMEAGRDAIGEGVPEFEVAMATSAAGTRKAAELLERHYDDANMSPNTHFLQIMASGPEVTMPHHRATTRRMQRGEPVFLCFCGMTNFHRFKLGFDRTFWIGEVRDTRQADIYRVAVDSQAAALALIRPGVRAEEVHAAYADVIQGAGYEYPFRCGRATGFSFVERPQLVFGDKTVLQAGMVLAVDGSVSVPGYFRAQVGDSIIVTDAGYEPITSHPKSLDDVIVG
jgi:Xaa-Pro aminopeptidase